MLLRTEILHDFDTFSPSPMCHFLKKKEKGLALARVRFLFSPLTERPWLDCLEVVSIPPSAPGGRAFRLGASAAPGFPVSNSAPKRLGGSQCGGGWGLGVDRIRRHRAGGAARFWEVVAKKAGCA